MKKYLFGIVFLLSAYSFAQLDSSSTRFGVTAGGNLSQVIYAHNPSGTRVSFQFGGLVLIPIGYDEQFYIQGEAVYYGAGEIARNKKNKDSPFSDGKYHNNYLSIPIYFKTYFSRDASTFFGMIGPRLNFLLNQKVTDASEPYYTIEGVDIPRVGNVNGKASGFNFAIAFGVGFSFKRQVELNLKYDFGVSETYKGLDNEPGNDPDIAKTKSEQVISLGISYIFQ